MRLPPWQEGVAGFIAQRVARAMRLLVCGGAGFIGSTFVRLRIAEHGDEVTVLDKLTYAGREENLRDVADAPGYRFVHGGIEDPAAVAGALEGCEAIVNFAAETHVDRSIAEPDAFVTTQVMGTWVLLEAARERGLRYVQVSTDEVYGSIEEGSFTESSPLDPSSPYSATKAGRRPAGLQLPPHLRPGHVGVPRLEQLRPVPVPREAHPADDPQRAARRRAAGLRRRAQVRNWIWVEDFARAIGHGARARRAGADLQRRAAPTRAPTSRSCSASSSSPGADRR